jgi:hypothetical protein
LLTAVNVLKRELKRPLIAEVSEGADEIDVDAAPE